MTTRRIIPTFAVAWFFFTLTSETQAQQPFELPEIRGFYTLTYQDLRIEIVRIDRAQHYQPYYPNSVIPRGPEYIAEDGCEIAVVHIQTERLSTQPGVRVSHLVLYDMEGKEYQSDVQTFSIGSGSERKVNDPKIHDYEFPVMVPQGTRFKAVQLRRNIYREESPQHLIQRITFELVGW
jgi:hypothetical protein